MPQSRDITRRKGPVFWFQGIDTEPPGPEWARATAAERRRYRRILAKWLADRKDWELSQGWDWTGEDLKPIRPRTWEERQKIYTVWTGPPLMPQYDGSRTRKLLQFAVRGPKVVGYWPKRWGRILRHHCLGNRRKRLPVRDVAGITEEGWRLAVRRATAEWRGGLGPAVAPPAPVVPPAPRPIMPPRPAPAPKPRPTAEELARKYPFLRAYKIADVEEAIAAAEAPVVKSPWWRRAVGLLAGLLRRIFGR